MSLGDDLLGGREKEVRLQRGLSDSEQVLPLPRI